MRRASLTQFLIERQHAGKINADDALENVDVDVKVKKNVVTISGDVPSAALRDRVLRNDRDTEGVSRVIDHMTVTKRPNHANYKTAE